VPDQFPVSLNLSVFSQFFAGLGFLSDSDALLEITVDFVGPHQAIVKYDYLGLHRMNPGGFENLDDVDHGTNAVISTPEVLATVGQVPLSLKLVTEASVRAPFFESSGNGGSAVTLALPSGIDVFNLPPGYSANASIFLVNNRFIPVPEPANWYLAVIGLILLIAGRVSPRSNAIKGALIA
jgi:hypothetical protein